MNNRAKLLVVDAEGNRYTWRYWRDAWSPACWMLEDHQGLTRALESNWVNSVPRINAILENYGMVTRVS